MKKLRNKSTGEVVNFIGMCVEDGRYELAVRLSENDKIFKFYYYSIADFYEKWQDYEEPEGAWFINSEGNVIEGDLVDGKIITLEKQAIGNFFKTKEEAEKAVEKLKAWKRLKDKGFEFAGVFQENEIDFEISGDGKKWNDEQIQEFEADLELLFGGEE